MGTVPPSSWDGGWDASLKCIAVDASNGTTTLTRNLTPGTDTVTQQGSVSCTFTDPANNFQETATCSLSIQFNNLSESCNLETNTLTVTGTCPTAQAVKVGTINCEGAGPGGSNPTFCGYAGNDPSGNESDFCKWTLGYGAKSDSSVVALTSSQCEQAFPGEGLDSTPPLLGPKEIFKFTQKYAGKVCTGEFAGLGAQKERFCHSDTWDEQPAFCDLSRPQTIGSSSVQGVLTADTDYTSQPINRKCPNNGVITLRVSANGVDPGTNDIAVEEINQKTITVNGFPIIPGSCNLKKDSLQCKVQRCEGDVSIVENTDTLTMEAFMNDGTPIVGDVETKKVSLADNTSIVPLGDKEFNLLRHRRDGAIQFLFAHTTGRE